MMAIYEIVARSSLVILAVFMLVFIVATWRLPKSKIDGNDPADQPPSP